MAVFRNEGAPLQTPIYYSHYKRGPPKKHPSFWRSHTSKPKGSSIEGLGFRVWGCLGNSKLKSWDCRVDLGFRLQGLGFRACAGILAYCAACTQGAVAIEQLDVTSLMLSSYLSCSWGMSLGCWVCWDV